MYDKLDLIGKKINFLIPQKHYKNGKHIYYECLCDCGNLTSVRHNDLINNKTKSCGCLKRKRTLSDDQCLVAKKLYFDDLLSIKDISKIFNCTETVLELEFKRRNYIIRDRSHQKRKFFIKEDIYDNVNSEEKAYWLGFLYADGSITGNRCISLHLSEQDKDHLEKFSYFIYNFNRVKFSSCKNKFVYVHAYNKHMCSRLIELGCVPNKTFKLKMPEWISSDLISHFIRGYFDGDGSISIYNAKIRSRKGGYTGNYYRRATFSVLSTFEFLSSLKDILKQNGINSSIVMSKKDRCVNNFTLSISGNLQIEKALDWLYKDSSVFLERKYNKFLELKKINHIK